MAFILFFFSFFFPFFLYLFIVYCELSNIIVQHSDLEFVELMVQMLNLILLTADELEPMRSKLKGK